MSYVADWLDPCWRYLFRRRASDTVPRYLHMSFGRSWTSVEILVDKFLAQVGAPVEETPSNRFEEG
jgi:hypothetical protein